MKRALLSTVLAVFAMGALANEFCDTRGKVREHRDGIEAIWKSFTDKKMDEVERYFGGMIAEHDAGRLSDAHLGRAFGAFECSHTGCEPLIQEWVRLYPRSPAAHLALAHYYAMAGFNARGSQFASETADTQFVAMGEAFRKAFEELAIADKYTKRPTLSASVRIWLGAAAGGIRPRPTETYRAAIKAFPDTLQVRIRYIHASTPKWGGSMRQLESIVDDAKPMSPADRRYVEYLVLQEMGNTLQCGDCGPKDEAKAAQLYKKSVALCPGLDKSLEFLIDLQVRNKDYNGALVSTAELIERDPGNGWAHTKRGYAFQSLGKDREAIAEFEKGTQLAHGLAYLYLAWHYEMGRGVARDYRKAIEYYTVADRLKVEAAKGHAERLRKLAAGETK